MTTETHRTGKPCYRCNVFVRMSGPEAARNPNTWTLCAVCKDKLAVEVRFVGTVVESNIAHQPRP